jgi:hypothetical protein
VQTFESDQKMSDLVWQSVASDYTPILISISAVWIILEGIQVTQENNNLLRNTSLQSRPYPTQAQQQYLSLHLEAVNEGKEDIRQVALHDLTCNAAIANILPYLFHFIQEMMTNWFKFSPAYVFKLLHMVNSVFSNETLYLSPYAESTLVFLHSIIFNSDYRLCSNFVSHWEVRELAAYIISSIMKKCSSTLTTYYKRMSSSIKQHLSTSQQSDTNLPVLYGILTLLCHLGGNSIGTLLLPRVIQLTHYIEDLLNGSKIFHQHDALHVYNVLLIAVETLLMSSFGQTKICSEIIKSFEPLNLSHTFPESDLSMQQDISLYDFLIEMFGERLNIKLNSVFALLSLHGPTKLQVKPAFGTFPELQKCVDKSFKMYQNREGFKSVCQEVFKARYIDSKPGYDSTKKSFIRFSLKVLHLPKLQRSPSSSHVPSQTITAQLMHFKQSKTLMKHVRLYIYNICAYWL